MSLFFKRPPPFSDTTAACLLHRAPQIRVMMPTSVLKDFTARRARQSPLGARLACSRTWPDWWVWISVRTAHQVWGLGSLTLSAYLVQIDGLVQERRNSIANALELRLSCTNPSKWCHPKRLARFYKISWHLKDQRKYAARYQECNPIFSPNCTVIHDTLYLTGYYCETTGLDAPTGVCNAGYYCPWAATNANFIICPEGYYCGNMTDDPDPCPAGEGVLIIFMLNCFEETWKHICISNSKCREIWIKISNFFFQENYLQMLTTNQSSQCVNLFHHPLRYLLQCNGTHCWSWVHPLPWWQILRYFRTTSTNWWLWPGLLLPWRVVSRGTPINVLSYESFLPYGSICSDSMSK